MSEFVTVARVEDVPENEVRSVQAGGKDLVLINVGGVIHTLEDVCSHEEFPLSAGEYSNGQITCALHGARFDVATGAPRALPAVLPVKTYETRLEGDEVQVRLEG